MSRLIPHILSVLSKHPFLPDRISAVSDGSSPCHCWPLQQLTIPFSFRIYARAWKLGVRNYQADDYLTILVAVLYTILIVCLNTIAQGGGSNLYPPELEGTFMDKEIANRIAGSKIVVISEQAMLNVIYTIKVCMLIMYTRLTLGLTVQNMVRYLAIYVFVGWVATEIAFFTACRPFVGYWGMPPPNPQCATLEHYAIVQGCFNISSDVLMLFIPLPLVIKMKVKWRQKIVLVFIFSLGVFVIVAALLTKIFNLTDIFEPTYMNWYVREASVAVFVGNLPMIWPLMREWFPCLRTLTHGSKSSHVTMKFRGRQGGKIIEIPNATLMSGTTSRKTVPSSRGKWLDEEYGDDTSTDSTYDVEMGIVRGRDEKGESSESVEWILHSSTTSNAYTTNDGLDHGSREQEKNDGIQVERTVEISEEMLSPRSQTISYNQGAPEHLEWNTVPVKAQHKARKNSGSFIRRS